MFRALKRIGLAIEKHGLLTASVSPFLRSLYALLIAARDGNESAVV